MNAGSAVTFEIESFFPGPRARFLKGVGRMAEEQNTPLALVGGPVRDCLMKREVVDVDFIVEGKAEDFLIRLLSNWRADFSDLPLPKITSTFPQFGTAKLVFDEQPDGFPKVLDFASARTERYPRPGRAPEVTYPCSIAEDLRRRDFSINSMAFRLDGSEKFGLVDPLQGVSDLQLGLLRVLHPKSFSEDPARIFRAVRFLTRFGFQFEGETARLFDEAVEAGLIQALTPQRKFDEFRKALREDRVTQVLRKLSDLSVLSQIHPSMKLSEAALAASDAGEFREEKVVGALLEGVPDQSYEDLLKSWGLSRKLAAQFVQKRRDVV